jgi:flagellar biosynthesis/type III secretory pathway chaperone
MREMPKSPPAVAAATPHAIIAALIALLEQEQQLLAQPQADALEAIARQKQALLNQMEAPDRNTQARLKDPALRTLVARAQRLNGINARLLASHRFVCESRLNLLRGGLSANTLYRANGYLGA